MADDTACALCGEPRSAVLSVRLCASCAGAVFDEMHPVMCRQATSGTPQPAIERPCWVYYVERGDRIKIGCTAQLHQRMTALMPDRVLALEPGDFDLEATRHRQFREWRISGEWFAPSDELLAHIDGVRREHPQDEIQSLQTFRSRRDWRSSPGA